MPSNPPRMAVSSSREYFLAAALNASTMYIGCFCGVDCDCCVLESPETAFRIFCLSVRATSVDFGRRMWYAVTFRVRALKSRFIISRGFWKARDVVACADDIFPLGRIVF